MKHNSILEGTGCVWWTRSKSSFHCLDPVVKSKMWGEKNEHRENRTNQKFINWERQSS